MFVLLYYSINYIFVNSLKNYFVNQNQATQEVVSKVPVTTYEEFKAAVFAAKRAFLSWRNTPLTARQRVMFRFQELIQRDIVSSLGSIHLTAF